MQLPRALPQLRAVLECCLLQGWYREMLMWGSGGALLCVLGISVPVRNPQSWVGGGGSAEPGSPVALPGHVVVIKSLPGQRCSAAGMQEAVSVPVPVFGKASRGRTWISRCPAGVCSGCGISRDVVGASAPGPDSARPSMNLRCMTTAVLLGTVWGGAAHPDPLPWGWASTVQPCRKLCVFPGHVLAPLGFPAQ